MALPLTIRNLTPTIIVLKSLERFEDPNTKQSKATPFPSASNSGASIAPSAGALGMHAQSFKHQDIDIILAPYESYIARPLSLHSSSMELFSTLSSVTFRITIENDRGERYRMESNPAYTQKGSQLLTPLKHNPSTSYTALFHPTRPSPHLAIHSNHLPNYSEWMKTLPDNLPLSSISIPGTHNSHTHYRALPSVRCQSVDVATQLVNGIRFLDIRVQPANATSLTNPDLYLVHGAFPISLTATKHFGPILQTCLSFLTTHPSETILLSLKREGTGRATDAHLAHLLQTHYISPHAAQWYTAPTLPSLASARGKIVLIRRYDIPPHISPNIAGLDATAWPNSLPLALHGVFAVQDYCDVTTPAAIPTKLAHAIAHLERAAGSTAWIPGANTDEHNPLPPEPLHLNYLSGSNFFNPGTWPEKIAKVVNRGVEEWVCGGLALGKVDEGEGKEQSIRRKGDGDGGTGVVVMDFVGEGGDWDLARLVVGLNMGVLGVVEGRAWKLIPGR